jgi:hypothetical protein
LFFPHTDEKKDLTLGNFLKKVSIARHGFATSMGRNGFMCPWELGKLG